MSQDYIPNERVTFVGFAEGQEMPPNAELLEVGHQYVVVSADEDQDEPGEYVYTLEVANPEFDDSKRESKNNSRVVTVEVFGDEIERFETEEEEEEEEEEEAPPKKVAAKKTPAKKAPAKKTAPAKKAATKKAPAKKSAPAKAKKGAAQAEAAAESEVRKARREHESDPELRGMIILNDEEEDQEILDLVASTDDIVSLARDLVEDNANTEWKLGGVLYHARIGKDYKSYNDGQFDGVGGWADFVGEVLGLEYRKAQYLIDIYTTFRRFGKGPEDLAAIGWSKAIQITKHMDEDNADQLVDMASEQSVRDLKESISTSFRRETATKKVVKMVRFNFVLEESVAEFTRELFEQIKAQMGIEDDNQCFEQIVSEYAQSTLDAAAIRKAQRGTTKAKAKAPAKKAAATKAPAKKAAAPRKGKAG